MKRYAVLLAFVVVLVGAALLVQRVSADSHGLTYPEGYRSWTHVTSMLIHSKDHPLYDPFGGLHHVYVNDKGLKALKSGGKYPDGSILVFDLYDVKEDGGAYVATDRKFIGLMVKDAKKYKDTGGWGWEVFKGNSKSGGNVKDAKTECFNCHASQKESDFVFSKYQQ
ncbi:MAG: cytochrome C [Armatimonadota bacterium]